MGVHKLHVKNNLLNRVRALGNSKRGLKELCSDLVNSMGTDPQTLERIAEGTFLNITTIRRMSTLKECDTGEPYRPNEDTMNRILRYFNAEVTLESVHIKSEYQNKAKLEL